MEQQMTFVARTLSPWAPVTIGKNALSGNSANFYDRVSGLTRSLGEGNPVSQTLQASAVEVIPA